MTRYVWEDLFAERDRQVISKAGYDKEGASSWGSRGMGTNPMVPVIDMQRLVAGEDEPVLDAIDEYRTAMGDVARETSIEASHTVELMGLWMKYTDVLERGEAEASVREVAQ